MTTFEEVFNEVKSVTMYDAIRCKILYDLCQEIEDAPGAIAELGVFRGGTARFLAKCLPRKTIHAFDTFTGMPPLWSNELGETYFDSNAFSEHDLEQTARKFLSDCPNVELHVGVFPESIPDALRNETFCLFHFDGDLYRSCVDSLEFFYPRLIDSGIILFDDYQRQQCPGVRIGIEEFFAGKKELLIARHPESCCAWLRKNRSDEGLLPAVDFIVSA